MNITTYVFPQLVSNLRLIVACLWLFQNLRPVGGFRFALAHRLPSSCGNKSCFQTIEYILSSVSFFLSLL